MFRKFVGLGLTALLLVAAEEAGVSKHSQDFPKGAGPENVVLRPSGDIVAAIGTEPQVYQVGTRANAAPKLLHQFSNALGISSIAPGPGFDEYYLISGNFSYATLTPTPGSYVLHRLSFDRTGQPVVKDLKVLDVAQPNGMIHVPGTPFLLLADCYGGYVYRINVDTLETKIYFDDPLLKPKPQDGFAFGVNGIKLARGYLYFSNTNQGLVARIRATGLEPKLRGKPEVVVTQAPVDDFTVNSYNGDLFLALNTENAMGYVAGNSNQTAPQILLGGGNSTALLGPTAMIWSQGGEGKELVVPISGGFLQYVEQNFTGGARIDTVSVRGHP